MKSGPGQRAQHWLFRLAVAAVAVAALTPLAALVVDRAWGREVLLMAPHDPKAVALNRALWSSGEPVAPLYGNSMSEAVRVIVVDSTAVFHPDEDPRLALMPVGGASRRPLQSRTLWWAARWAVLGSIAAAAGCLLGGLALRGGRRASGA